MKAHAGDEAAGSPWYARAWVLVLQNRLLQEDEHRLEKREKKADSIVSKLKEFPIDAPVAEVVKYKDVKAKEEKPRTGPTEEQRAALLLSAAPRSTAARPASSQAS